MRRTRLCSLLASLCILGACATPPAMDDRHLTSPNFRDGKFRNFDAKAQNDKTFWDVLKWRLTAERADWPLFLNDNATPEAPARVDDATLRITMLNHASFLIQGAGVNIITDPVFSDRASPFTFLGPKRHRAPGIALADLPALDAVLVSHAHYEHLDRASLNSIETSFAPRYFAPLRNHDLLPDQAQDDKRIAEMDWSDSLDLTPRVKIIFLPAQHWSARGLFDRNDRFWGAYLIRFTMGDGSIRQVYFAGDTGYNSHFADVAKTYGAVDVALLPIGAYEPRWFMQMQHMNPSDAIMAHRDLQSKRSIGMHFGTFQLTDEAIDQPAKDLKTALDAAGIGSDDFAVPQNGQTFLIE